MNRNIIYIISGIGLLILIFLILFYYYDIKFRVPIINVTESLIKDTDINVDSYTIMYGITKNDLVNFKKDNIRLKIAKISCRCDNNSFFKSYNAVKFNYVDQQKIPNIILGSHPDEGFMQVNIQKRSFNRMITLTVLINPKEYSDNEILEMLKSVEVVMVNKINGKEDKVSNTFFLVKN